ncbi:6973_t:CDS:2, partial [Funneliformis caledonium]
GKVDGEEIAGSGLQFTTANQLNGLNNKLVSQITCERKSHADLNAKQLKEIESLRSMVKSLESIISSMQKASSLKDSDIASLKTKINELEVELEQITQKVLLKDSDTNQSRVSNLEDELDQIVSQPHQSINDSKIGSAEADPVSSSNDYKRGEVVKEVFHFSSHCLESEPDERKVKDEIGTQRDHLHVDQKSKEKHDSILASPIIVLGAGKALVDNH